MPRKKIVLVATRFPFPIEKGDKLRTYYLLKYLQVHHDIYLITLTEDLITTKQVNEIKQFTKEIHLFKLTKFRKFIRLFFGLFNNKPLQVNYFTDYKIKVKISALLDDIKPDHIICQLIRSAEYVKNYHHCPKTIDYMDALSKGMERRAIKSNFFLKFIFDLEARRLKDYEQRIFNYFENQAIISQQDLNYIAHPDKNKMLILPNGIDAYYFEALQVKQTYDLVFVGNLNYPPNIDAINFILESILPAIPNRTLLISGANPSNGLIQQIKSTPNASITGWVDDIRTSYLQGKILVAPMQIGTGMQNKILEAMALGIPTVTTTLANNAINGLHQESIWVADTKEEIIQGIETLLTDMESYENIQKNAREFVIKKYNWTAIVNTLEKAIQV